MRYLFYIAVVLNMVLWSMPKESLVQGGLAIFKLDDRVDPGEVLINGKKATLIKHGKEFYALQGIGLNTKPGQYVYEIKTSKTKKNLMLAIKHKAYEEQHLTVTNKRKVNPNPQDMKRIEKESEKKRLAKNSWSDVVSQADYIWPTEGRISSIFGLRRFFNGQERRPHSGLDIAAPKGTPVHAIQSGRVVEANDFFFSGNVIYLEHGHGIVSMYAHLSSIDVKPGDFVNQGDVIGKVGATGRVTGPHLHLSLLVNGVSIDPILFLPHHVSVKEK